MQTKFKKQSVGQLNLNGKPTIQEVPIPHLQEYFEEQLKGMLWAEKALTKAIPKMITLATSKDLILALTHHLHQTIGQVTRLATVFKTIDKKPRTVICEVIENLIKEADEIPNDCEKGPSCDVAIIATAKKMNHYEITTYETLRKFAEKLGLTDAVRLLNETQDIKKEADQKLTEVVVQQGVNEEATFV